jgi:hypothetical protein
MSNDLVKLPNSLVSAVEVDEEGMLWFVCGRPAGDINQYNLSFPVRLHFYRKGTMFHLEVSGKATIVQDDLENDTEGPLLIKMSMNNIEYTEPHEKKKGKVESLLEKGYLWIMKNVALPHDNRSALSKLNSMREA